VAAEGRVLPLDTWAPVVYARLSGRNNDPGALAWFLRLVALPETTVDEPFLLVDDPAVLAGTGAAVPARGRYSPRVLAPVFARADDWVRRFADDPSAPGRESLRLARALILYRTLAATFALDDPAAGASPLRVVDVGGRALNPAEALAAGLTGPEKDRLGLWLYWHDRSRAGQWAEAAAALGAAAGPSALLEVVHNRIPWAALTALLAALGGALAWVGRRRPNPGLAWASGLAWALVTTWLVVRMVISGRPPITNLPATFLFVAWVALGLAFWLSFRPAQRTSALLALGAGALLPLLSGVFQAGSDPFSPLQAVLNTNFWLTLHVTIIVSGYAGTLAAGLLGHAYLVAAQARGGGTRLVPLWKNLHLALGTALVLTITGTLLGGFWADQSWGRFWGWDPKENGALMLILWLALTLHLRPARLAQEWGTAVAAAVLIPVLLFSWLGVNLLGVGFHSYGAAPGKALVFFGLLALDALFLAFVAVRRALR